MKTNFKKTFAAIAAAAMCAVPMANSFSASAADLSLARSSKAIKYDLSKADLTKLDASALKAQFGNISIDTRIPIDPYNPHIPELPPIKRFVEKEPGIRDIIIRKPYIPPTLKPISQASQVVEEILKFTYTDTNNKVVTAVIGYTSGGRYIVEYWTNYSTSNGTGRGALESRTELDDPAYNTSLVAKITNTEYYLDFNYRLRKEITGYTKNNNKIVENWRFSDVTGKWQLMSRTITKVGIAVLANSRLALAE